VKNRVTIVCLLLYLTSDNTRASWYTGRGIRPLGRFGRKAARRNELLAFITARVYRPTADSGVWITQ
uniref:Prolactin releasing hormone 2 n=1 Tax=Oreochromis aureus TaxID=47969 RepID=A0A668T1C1_OREAU